MPLLPASLRNIIFGNPWGETFPPKPNPPPLSFDGRTVALRILRDYITNLDFFLPMGPHLPPKKFKILPQNFQIEWPDHEFDVVFPMAVVVSAPARYDSIGLTAYIEEKTRDVYQKGTVLQWQSEYTETIMLELWASKKAERRSMLAGIETALTPTEQMYGLRFRMPDYFNELVCFTLNGRELLDDPMSAKDRRRVRLMIEMRFNIVALVNYQTLVPIITTNTDVVQPSGIAVDLTSDPNAQTATP